METVVDHNHPAPLRYATKKTYIQPPCWGKSYVGGTNVQFSERTVRRRTQRSIQRGKSTDQGTAQDGEGSVIGRVAPGLRRAPATNPGACRAPATDFRNAGREGFRQEVSGDGRSGERRG